MHPYVFPFVDLSAYCQHLQYHFILYHCRFTERINMPKAKKKTGFKNQCFNAWHTEWNSSSDKLVDVASIPGFNNVIKALKKLASKRCQKPLNIEYRNTTRICIDCLPSSKAIIFEKKRNFTALLEESDLLRFQSKVRFVAKINVFLTKISYLCLLIKLLFHHYQSSNEENNVVICSFFSFVNRFKH